jgi:hypothetical protein
MIEILESVETFIDSPLFVNIIATVFILYGTYEKITKKFAKKDNDNLRFENTQLSNEVKDLKNVTKKEYNELKEMFLLAFNNSKLSTEVKLKLNDLSKGKGFLNIKKDIIEPIKENIKSKNIVDKNIKNDLIDKLVSKIDEDKEV